MPSSPKTSLTDPEALTLSSLPSEIVALIYSFYLAQNPIENRSHFLNLITLSKEIYSENAWRLYEVVELDDWNCEAFLKGVWVAGGFIKKAMRLQSPSVETDDGSDWPDFTPGDLVDEIELFTPPRRPLERPTYLSSDSVAPYATYEYESHIPFHLHPCIRKVLLIRQCRRLYIHSCNTFEGLQMCNHEVQRLATCWLDGRISKGWAIEPLFFSVTHLSFGTPFMAYYHLSDPPNRDWLIEFELFGPSLKHICLALCDDFDDFYDVFSFSYNDRDGDIEYTRKRVTETLEGDVPFALWYATDRKTSLTLHDARPEAFEVFDAGLADTMIYEMPRKTDAGVDEWKKQIMMIKGEMGAHMSELGYKLRQGEAGADRRVVVWKPQFPPCKIRFTNMAPLPADVDLPQLFLNDCCYSRDGPYEQFDQVFRKWWAEVVSSEGPTACECCDIFKMGHPKIGVMSSVPVQEWYFSREDKALHPRYIRQGALLHRRLLCDPFRRHSIRLARHSFAVPSISVLGSVLDGVIVV
ncbi:hypothetical protein L198_06786 [Cryptococcus wingfieldii CBS 7118]|uniref:Uncharacterized protein n=1 Tax=Cryptococcus wingfieldii CBS 7118 TaxID=1295528 RepID=A0A1E3IHZ5_9TREE|nr:hypothetical protein L198_06786 [Cryptococcus wingfieldii CBS 7118]ODN88045.1 hypothetical protein L198_06786 [Cryptococcus wingfieldii CBS 7118]